MSRVKSTTVAAVVACGGERLRAKRKCAGQDEGAAQSATRSPGVRWTGLCAGERPWSSARADVRMVGSPCYLESAPRGTTALGRRGAAVSASTLRLRCVLDARLSRDR